MDDFNLYGNDFMNPDLAGPDPNNLDPGMSGPAGEQGETPDDLQGDEPGSELTAAQRQKHKRRSKNDLKGRDYQCGCGKRYLSYPALYTHIKTKHGGQNPKGTNAPQYQSGRGRGRPRKV